MSEKRLLQFVGTQRSGSNLLRVMLGQIEGVMAPHPPHILKTFTSLLPLYGDLGEKKNYKRLVEDVCSWVENNPVPWDGVTLIPEKIIKLSKTPHLIEAFRLVYEAAANAHGATYWSCKSMANTHYFSSLETLDPKPFYIYLYRDGRDVALSFKKAYVGEKHIYFTAKKWHEDQQKALELCAQVPQNRLIQIRYEDMLADAKGTIQKICKALNIPFQESFSSYYKSKEAENTSVAGEMWENLNKPVMKNNYNKYKKGLTKEEIEIFEIVAGKSLKALGYSLENPENALEKSFAPSEIEAFQKSNKEMKQEVKKTTNPDELRRKQWQEKFMDKCQKELAASR